MYSIKANDDQYQFKLAEKQPESWDMIEYKDGCFHILLNNKSYSAEVLEADYVNKEFTIRVNGQVFDLQVEDKFDQLIREMGFAKTASNKVNFVKAPMPGLVVDILVEPGQTVEKGTSLLILGAMKMDNVIKSAGDGVVKKIAVDKGASVDKNQLLVELE